MTHPRCDSTEPSLPIMTHPTCEFYRTKFTNHDTSSVWFLQSPIYQSWHILNVISTERNLPVMTHPQCVFYRTEFTSKDTFSMWFLQSRIYQIWHILDVISTESNLPLLQKHVCRQNLCRPNWRTLSELALTRAMIDNKYSPRRLWQWRIEEKHLSAKNPNHSLPDPYYAHTHTHTLFRQDRFVRLSNSLIRRLHA